MRRLSKVDSGDDGRLYQREREMDVVESSSFQTTDLLVPFSSIAPPSSVQFSVTLSPEEKFPSYDLLNLARETETVRPVLLIRVSNGPSDSLTVLFIGLPVHVTGVLRGLFHSLLLLPLG